jgi:lactoylglutathione lyase
MRILYTMLRVGDLDKSIAFYVEVLGMSLLRKKDYPKGKFTLGVFGLWTRVRKPSVRVDL